MLSEVEYDPVKHLSSALFPFDQKVRLMAMITRYYDESENTPLASKPDMLRVYTVAACVGLDRQWVKFQKKWKAVLDEEVLPQWRQVYGPDKPVFFHMTEFANPHSKIYGAWSDEKKQKLLRTLHSIMAKHVLRRFATGILLRDYDQLSDEEKFALGHPHAAATIHILKRIRDWAIREGYNEPMLDVFELGSPHDKKIRKLFESALSDDLRREYRSSGLAFKDKREMSPLQASDILATETRWEVCRQFDPAITRNSPRRSAQNLYMPNVDEWTFMDGTHLKTIINNPIVQDELERHREHLPEVVAKAKKKGWI